MSLYCGSRAILTYGEALRLMQELPPGFSDKTLNELFLGVAVDPVDVDVALNVSIRLAAGTAVAHELIDTALDRLHDELPEPEPVQEAEPDAVLELKAEVAALREALAERAEQPDWSKIAQKFAEALQPEVRVEVPVTVEKGGGNRRVIRDEQGLIVRVEED